MIKVATIAGSDASGGAGLEADLKTFEEYGLYGMAAVTVIATMDPSNNWSHGVYSIPEDVLRSQLDTIFEGVYLNEKNWLSVNIIEGYDDLFIHTTLKPKSNNIINMHIENNLRGFNIRTTSLFRVGKISNRVDDLVDIIHKDILPNIN